LSRRNLAALHAEREAGKCGRVPFSLDQLRRKTGHRRDHGDRRVSSITIRPATPADVDRIRAWLRQPEIEAWWGPASATTAEVQIALQSSSAFCRVVEADGRPIGYCHAIDAKLWGDDLPEDLEPGTWDLDIFIAAPEYRGQGAGLRALELLKAEVFSTTLATAVCVFASIRNEAAVRAYEKAGFTWQRIWNDSASGPSWFMIARRPGPR
jgi:aminoglycoside 6'-N-acetyltransferase